MDVLGLELVVLSLSATTCSSYASVDVFAHLPHSSFTIPDNWGGSTWHSKLDYEDCYEPDPAAAVTSDFYISVIKLTYFAPVSSQIIAKRAVLYMFSLIRFDLFRLTFSKTTPSYP